VFLGRVTTTALTFRAGSRSLLGQGMVRSTLSQYQIRLIDDLS